MARIRLSGDKKSDLTWKPGGGWKRRKWLLPGEHEVWKNRLYVNEERGCFKRAEFLPTECSSTRLAFILPFSTISMKQERQTQILPLMNPIDMELWTQTRQNGDQKQRMYILELLFQKEQERYPLRWGAQQEVDNQTPLFRTVGIGCKMLSAWASLDPIFLRNRWEWVE